MSFSAYISLDIPRDLPARVSGTQVNDTDPGSPLFPQEPIKDGSGNPLPTYQPTDEFVTYPQIGQSGRALATLLDAGNAANAPVPDAAHAKSAILAWRGRIVDYLDQVDPPPPGMQYTRNIRTDPYPRAN